MFGPRGVYNMIHLSFKMGKGDIPVASQSIGGGGQILNGGA